MTCTHSDPCSIIIPLFFSEDEAFWLDEAGLDLMHDVVVEMKGCRTAGQVSVVTDNWKVARYLKDRRIGVNIVPGPAESDVAGLPRGSATALKHVFGEDGRERPCMVRDVRQLGIECETVKKLSEGLAGDAGEVVTTVVVPRDHPCQLKQYYRSRAVGFVLPFDMRFATGEESDALVTVPFMAGLPETIRPGEVLEKQAFLTGRYEARTDLAHGCASGKVMLLAEGHGRGRLAFPASAFAALESGFTPVGALGFCTDREFQAVLVRNEEDGRLLLLLDNAGGVDCDSLLLHMEDEAAEYTVPFAFGNAIAVPPAMSGKGFFITLARKTYGGEYDVDVHFPSKHGLWHRTASGVVNSHTEQVIHGRQGFPEVFTLDAGLVFGRINDLLAFSSAPDAMRLRGHVLEDEMRITCAFDLLKSRIHRNQARGPEAAAIVGSWEL